MAFFGFGKKEQPADDAQGPAKSEGPLEFSPQKAERWFSHARTSYESDNFEYAAACWLNGLRFDPANPEALKSFFNSAAKVTGKTGGKIPPDVAKAAAGKTPVDKYLEAIMRWGFNPPDAELAVRAVTACVDLGLRDALGYFGPHALNFAASNPKPKKDQFARLMSAFMKGELFSLALRAGESALRLDPTDSALSAELRNLAAQDTMNKGGFEKTGEAGGFRANIKDAEKQRRLEEESRLSKTEDVAARVLDHARTLYQGDPGDKPNMKKYVAALLERGTPDDEQLAITILEEAYQRHHEFSFRKAAGEIRLKQGRRQLRSLLDAHQKNPSDEPARAAFLAADARQLALELSEYQALVEAYPTDLGIKFELGKRYALSGQHSEAIEQFQVAKDDAKAKTQVLMYLGKSFEAIEWIDEAIETFRLALEGHFDANDTTGLELRYELCRCLQKRAGETRTLPDAEEAYKLASAIAIQQITYKDIRTRRDAIKQLVAGLKS